MAKMHDDLNAAKRNPKDEFYTTRKMIEDELCEYGEYFKDKVVYCNCDDPEESEFWKFFVRNFKAYGIKKLMATHYEPDEKNYAYMLELTEDTNGDGRIDYLDEPTITQIPCNGDFRSAYCIELLKQADIVVTNPPFSLWREYIAQLMKYEKKFIIVGNVNAVKYKDVFPLIQENKLWMGHSIHSGDRKFYIPDDYPMKASGCGIDDEGRRFIRVKGVRWFTNLDIPQRHQPLDIRGNYYDPEIYPHYDNYDAIEVSKTSDIPCDYDGIMGVPITFLDKYCPDQFEIIGMTDRQNTSGVRSKKYTEDDTERFNDLNASAVLKNKDGSYKSLYTRFLIKRKAVPDED